MFRELFTLICTAEILAPEALITAAERVALDNPDDCDWRFWVTPVARLEGLVLLGTMWQSDASYWAFKRFLGLVGLLALFYPRAYVNYGGDAAYTGASTPEWKPWVYTGTRLVGLLYVIIALNEVRGKQ